MSIFSRLSTGKPGFGSFFFPDGFLRLCGLQLLCCHIEMSPKSQHEFDYVAQNVDLFEFISILCSKLGFISNDGPNFYILGIPCLETSLEGSLNSKSW